MRDFYPRFVFQRVQTYHPEIAADISNPAILKRNYSPDSREICDAILTQDRFPRMVDSVNTQPVQMLHLLLEYDRAIYYFPECDAFVISEKMGNTLFIADIITNDPVIFEEISRHRSAPR